MNDYTAAQFLAFENKGEGDECAHEAVLVEVTNFQKSGDIEIAFDAPVPGNMRMYLRFSLPEIIQNAMNHHIAEG